jgi:hypothetical protein
MALVKRASNKSQSQIYLNEQEGEKISLNSIAKTFQSKTAVGQIFDSVKDECRFLGDYAFKHFYIDYELQREKKFTWESITNNLLNSQSKLHIVLTGKKAFTEVTADDIFKKRKMVIAKRDDGSIFVAMQDDSGVS